MSNVRDSDTSLWLYNKLGTSNETWIGGSICSQLNATVLRNIQECFMELQTQVKLKLLLTFLHIPRKHIEEWRPEMEGVLATAVRDSDQWVSMLAEMLQTFPATGSLNTDIGQVEENKNIFRDLVADLKELLNGDLDLNLLPLEHHYLNKTAFSEVAPERHFQLRRQPRAVALRADLLRRADEAAAQLARHAAAAAAVPVRSRSAPRRPDTAGLLRTPSRLPLGDGEGRRSLPSLGLLPHQTRTVKLLDISEQPASHGKRRRKASAESGTSSRGGGPEEGEAAQEETVAPTPDYAAGLQCTPTPAPAATVPAPAARGPVTGVARPPCVDPQPAAVSTLGPSVSAAPYRPGPSMYAPQPPAQRPARPAAGCPGSHLEQLLFRRVMGADTGHAPQPVAPPPPPPPCAPQPPPAANESELHGSGAGQQAAAAARPPLTLTREQMLEAQEMFSTANTATRPEKALILGFIAGSRENPCPHLGDVVTIKLSESVERLAVADAGQSAAVLAETHFQMNYVTGEWKRIKKFRRLAS
ncbi:negative elongation factor A-like isoform X1 [Amphibalanus amphitrite]|uniref:negative elongation factor A-like isoform X1 n=1 Tax=Amphibalanus amphitrite TaxID=1232801 RepID=UPI001C91A19B|nr:negative elongation factor A-like isoform X1 [Amphibalanus amphitrite]